MQERYKRTLAEIAILSPSSAQKVRDAWNGMVETQLKKMGITTAPTREQLDAATKALVANAPPVQYFFPEPSVR